MQKQAIIYCRVSSNKQVREGHGLDGQEKRCRNYALKKGYSVIDILNEYYYFIKNTNILNETLKYNVITIICKYISYFYGKQEHNIELFLFTNELYNINN